jgi:hypothetical protein
MVHELGGAPLCEASGAVRAPWDAGLILVADNEVDDLLFSFTIANHGLLTDQHSIPVRGANPPGDLEALTTVDDAVVLVGSHSRGGRCVHHPDRQRIQVVRFDPGGGHLDEQWAIDGSAAWAETVADLPSCLAGLFTSPPPAAAARLCRSIVDTEATARKGACTTLDIEGAAAVGEGGEARVWLGLRQPRVGTRAALARLTSGLHELRFDAVVLLDVDRGVRAITARGDWLWLILGPAAPSYDRSCLARVPVDELTSGALLQPEVVVHDLPPNSEGLVFDGGAAIVLTDGDEPAGPMRPCEAPAGQVRVDLP